MEYAYDLAGKVLQVSDPTGSYGFAYDNMGRLIGTTTNYTFVTGTYSNAYSYDAVSNRTSLTAPDGSISTYGYDALNRLNGLANSWAGSFGFSYDALSRRTQLTRPNGVNTNYAYDSVSHLLSVLHQAGVNTLDGASYTYDAAGNRTSKTNYLNGVTSNYGYDPLYELTQVTQAGSTTESYTYDAVGNRLSSLAVPNYNYNVSNELTSNSNGSYTYDANGNTLSDASGKSFTWDFENRLVSAVVPGTNGGTTTFKYDPFGRRIYKQSPNATSIFVYDGANLLETVNGSGSEVASYTQTRTIDETLAELRGSATDYYEADALGSITSLSSSTGALANTYTYDSLGDTTASTGTLRNYFQYTGREFDPETGIYEYRSRYYDTSSGRFLSEDPIRFRGGLNFYRYVQNNPVGFADPLGLWPSATGIGAGIGGVLGGLAGGLIGAGGGTLVAPGVGTIGGGAEGVVVGAAGGAAAGAVLGAAIGNAVDYVLNRAHCDKDQVVCNYVGEFSDPSVDRMFKICSYSCSDGIGRSFAWPIQQACPAIQKGPWGKPW